MRERPRLSAARKALMWWLDWPGSPHVSLSYAVDFTAARDYLAQLAESEDKPPVSVHHLLAAAIGCVLREFPQANARIVGRRIERVEHVGLAMPVNLHGHAGARLETSMALIDHVDERPLRELAEHCRGAVGSEREGRNQNRLVRALITMADRAPYPVVAATLDAIDAATRNTPLVRLLYRQLPFTAVLTNGGAPFDPPEGALFRGVSMVLPRRFVHVPTVWGFSAVQDEVVVHEGQPAVRPMLPGVLIFDHRLFDGVLAGRLMLRFGEILKDPARFFGPEGERRPAHA